MKKYGASYCRVQPLMLAAWFCILQTSSLLISQIHRGMFSSCTPQCYGLVTGGVEGRLRVCIWSFAELALDYAQSSRRVQEDGDMLCQASLHNVSSEELKQQLQTWLQELQESPFKKRRLSTKPRFWKAMESLKNP